MVGEMHPLLFRGLSKLKKLNLGVNGSNKYGAKIFEGLDSLEAIWLHGNRFRSISRSKLSLRSEVLVRGVKSLD